MSFNSATIYDNYWRSGQHISKEWTLDYFQESLGPLIGKKCVLDYGCGMGYSYQRLLAQSVGKYIGADVSDFALKDAAKKGFQTIPIAPDGTIGMPDSSFDGAVCCEVFEHLWDPLAAARELYRVLQPGGILVATVPNFGYLPWRIRAFLQARVPAEPESNENRYKGVHIRFFSKYMLEQLLLEAGFSNPRVYAWDDTSIWHVFWAAGPLSIIWPWAEKRLHRVFHLGFLGKIWPSVFAYRLRIVVTKPSHP